MGGGERVVDVDVGEPRQVAGQVGVVPLLAGVEAGVLQQQDVAVAHRGHGVLGHRADAVGGEGHRAADRLLQGGGHRAQRHRGHHLAPGAVEVAGHDHAGALLGQLADRGGHALQAGDVGNLPVAHRQVEVHAQQDALAVGVERVDRAERHGGSPEKESKARAPPWTRQRASPLETSTSGPGARAAGVSRWRPGPGTARPWRVPAFKQGAGPLPCYRLPSRAAVSTMRLEKPHSLSYQPTTCAMAPPSTTWVCVASKEQDAGEWLKSELTSSAVL